jgi:hypothetical protein
MCLQYKNYNYYIQCGIIQYILILFTNEYNIYCGIIVIKWDFFKNKYFEISSNG